LIVKSDRIRKLEPEFKLEIESYAFLRSVNETGGDAP